MTEFLKGYAAGANDMEAGRLVTENPNMRYDFEAARADGFRAQRDAARVEVDRLRASALTAEEAQRCRVSIRHSDACEDEALMSRDTTLCSCGADELRAKLSPIANGENDG